MGERDARVKVRITRMNSVYIQNCQRRNLIKVIYKDTLRFSGMSKVFSMNTSI